MSFTQIVQNYVQNVHKILKIKCITVFKEINNAKFVEKKS